MLQIGFFIFFNLLAFFFLLYGIKQKKSMFGDFTLLFSMLLFFMLGFYMLPVEDIGTQITTISNSTSEQFTETITVIEDQETFYLIYIYYALALISFMFFILGKIPEEAAKRWGLSK